MAEGQVPANGADIVSMSHADLMATINAATVNAAAEGAAKALAGQWKLPAEAAALRLRADQLTGVSKGFAKGYKATAAISDAGHKASAIFADATISAEDKAAGMHEQFAEGAPYPLILPLPPARSGAAAALRRINCLYITLRRVHEARAAAHRRHALRPLPSPLNDRSRRPRGARRLFPRGRTRRARPGRAPHARSRRVVAHHLLPKGLTRTPTRGWVFHTRARPHTTCAPWLIATRTLPASLCPSIASRSRPPEPRPE